MAQSKKRVVRYDYVDTDGKSLGSKASPEAVGLNYIFLIDTGETNDKGAQVYDDGLMESVIFADYPDAINSAMSAHGWKQKGGDLFAGAKKAELDPIEMLQSGLEHLMLDEWNAATAQGGAGPKPSMVRRALIIVLVRDYEGDESDKEFMAKVTSTLDTSEKRQAALANASVKVEYERIKLEMAKERMESAAKEIKEGEADNSLLESFAA